VQLRDLYSELIKTSGEHAQFDVGSGDMEDGQNAPVATNKRLVVALFSRAVQLDKSGKAEVELDIPDYQGALRVMGVAWSGEGVGNFESEVVVKDPITTELYLPRFLSVGDTASSLVQARFEESVPAGKYTLKVASSDALDIVPKEFTLDVGSKREFREVLNIRAKGLGDANITLQVFKDGKKLASRDFGLASRVPYVKSFARSVGVVDGGAILDTKTAVDLKKWLYLSDIGVQLSSAPLLAIESMKENLINYCCRCAEQTTSRGFAFLDDAKHKDIVQESMERLYELQKFDGGFGLWQSSNASQWVSSYVLDFLTRAKEAGFAVSK
jgi:uncharacterized protein YfaS (alpha-2-macroglobulin family)